MISLSKEDIAKYLRDYAIMSELIREYPNIKIDEIHCRYLLSQERENEVGIESFNKMIRLYRIMTELRMFSFNEDLSIDYLNENELDFDNVKDKIFVNPDDAKSFSKKQVIKFIRNAVNHSDGNKQLYKISANGKYIEIHLQNTKPIPFHIKMSHEQLYKIHEELYNNSHNLLLSTIDYDNFDFNKPYDPKNLENMEFVHFYFPKKIDTTIMNILHEYHFSNFETCKERIDKACEILNANGYQNYTIKRFPLNDIQKAKIQIMMNGFRSFDLTKLDDINIKTAIIPILNEVIPLGMYHVEQLFFEEQFANWFMGDHNLTYNDISRFFLKVSTNQEFIPVAATDLNYAEVDRARYNYYSNKNSNIRFRNFMMNRDHETRKMYPMCIYFGYIADSLFNQEKICIDGKYYYTEKIRNAFVHGRWFFGPNESIELYDTLSGNDNDYNFHWHKSFNIRKLLSTMNDIYEEKEMSKYR